eukprot:gene14860-19976_t
MSNFISGFLKFFRPFYQKVLGSRLKAYGNSRIKVFGLKYDDLHIESPELTQAISRISEQAQTDRARRIKRAFDASAKKKTLPLEVVKNDNPFEFYLLNQIDKEKREIDERALLNG